MQIWQVILVICGGISAVGGAVAIIIKAIKPLTAFAKRVEKIEEHDRKDVKRFDAIDEEFSKIHKADQALYTAMIAILNHMIDGNHIDKMKAARAKLSEHIIEKAGGF